MILLIIFFALFGFAADAQTLPDRYMVFNVDSDDVLNIRAEPNASSDIISTFGPYTLNVEVLYAREGWGQVPTSEGWGWVNMAYLQDNPWPEGEVPRPLACSGTEPFWTFSLHPRGTEYNALADERGPQPQTILSETVAFNGFMIRAHDSADITRTLMVDGRICSDGMSERPFGMSATLFHETPGGNFVETGCCTLQVN